jgi:hypothetical protein
MSRNELVPLLPAINSATKYPSIPTYHAMGERGRLLPDLPVAFDGPVHVSEKIDGTNARIVVMNAGHEGPRYIIGSREELLTHSDDIVHNPALGIVDGLRSIAERTLTVEWSFECLVLFGELYGGRVGASSKVYTATQATGFRLFDVLAFSAEWQELLHKDPRDLAHWRDGGGQPFVPVDEIAGYADKLGASVVPNVGAGAPPLGVAETLAWLENAMGSGTRCAIDGPGGRAEGVVVRSTQGRRIAKVRFEDYERTTGKRGR